MAVKDSEVPILKDIYSRGIQNGLKGIEMVTPTQIREIEPSCLVKKRKEEKKKRRKEKKRKGKLPFL